MKKYKVLIFDLDGTAILNMPDAIPSNRLVKAIAAAKPNIKLCAATGRPITNAKKIVDLLDLIDPCIISAGTQIIDPQTYKILKEVPIEKPSLHKIIEICRPYHYELLMDDELIGEGKSAKERGTLDQAKVVYLMGCTESDAKLILEKLNKISSITAAGVISWTHEGVDIHITHENATKEHAVRELLRMLNIQKDMAIGVGDADNDVHLFKAVGYRVAMGNATKLLKSQADETCASVEEDGLAQLIERFV